MLILVGLVSVLALTALTGFFVAQEFAYVAVDRNRLQQRAEAGDTGAERALGVTRRLSFALSGAQFGITVTALLVGFVSEPYLGRGVAELLGVTGLSAAARVSVGVLTALVFSTAVQMVLGELGPKNWAIAEPERLAIALARPTSWYLLVFGPIIRFFDAAAARFLGLFGVEPVEELPQGATPEDLHRIIDESHAGGLLDEDLSSLLDRGLAFRHRVAEEVMTPRVDVLTLQADEPVSRLVELLESGHSRFPVTGRDIDDVVGLVSLSGLLEVPAGDRPVAQVKSIAEEPVRVPTSLPLPKVLEQLRTAHRQLAVVVDEHGGFAGVISFEDVAEEVVGEILDEDDEETSPATEREDGAWVLPARLRLDEVETYTSIALPLSDDYDTVSGLVMARLGRIAEPGETVEIQWDTRDAEGEERLAVSHVEVFSVERHVPDVVAVHPVQLFEPGETVPPWRPTAGREHPLDPAAEASR